MIIRLTAALIFMAACSPTGEAGDASGSNGDELADAVPEEEATPVVTEQCKAGDFRPLIGTPVAGATLSDDPMLRVYGENDIITQEYLPRRTNIVHDTRGIIRDVYCG